MQWNHEVDRALVSQVPEDEIRQIKKEFITDRIRQSIDAWGRQPELLGNIIIKATMRLALLISKVLTAARELKNKLFHEAMEKEHESKANIKAEDTADVIIPPVTEVITEPKPPVTTITATVQDFNTAFYTTQRATEAYQNECTKWEEAYGEKAAPRAETMHDKIKLQFLNNLI